MSVKERYNNLIAEEKASQEAERQKQLEEQQAERFRRSEANKVWQEKRDLEQPQILDDLELKIIKLRKLGIIGMFEEFTESNIFMLYSRNKDLQVPLSKRSLKEYQDRVSKRRMSMFTPHWEVKPIFPLLQEDLTWNNTEIVNLDINKVYQRNYGSHPFNVEKIEHVDLSYDGHLLTINGNGEEFSDKIPQKREQRFEIIERAFARAFFKPRIEVPELKQAPRRDYDFNTPIGISG